MVETLSGQQCVVLAALLHDIGKFAQRARVPLEVKNRALDATVYGRHGAHAVHSLQFGEQELQPHLRPCLSPILYHHNPRDPQAGIVAAGDRLSAVERQSDAPVAGAVYQPMANVLATVFASEMEQPPGPAFFALRRYDSADEGTVFPLAAAPDAKSQEQAYAELWRQFLAAHRQLDQTDLDCYLAGLFSLLQQYTWCIPSAAYGSVPDISLFDHSRVAAAFAAALQAYSDESAAGTCDPLALDAEPCFLLATGDLSGIQNYLYDIASADGVARRLRARSLYLQLLSEVAAQQLLADAGLTFVNQVLASGGHFHLLLPNTERGRRAVAAAQARADEWLLARHGGELALNLASVPFSPAELRSADAGFGFILRRASEALQRRKQQRLREALQNESGWREGAFLLPGFAGASLCPACGKQPRLGDDGLCSHCQTDLDAGRALAGAAYVALHAEERPGALSLLGHSAVVARQPAQVFGAPYLVLGLGAFAPEVAARWPLLARPLCNYIPTWTAADLARRPPLAPAEAHVEATVTFADLANRAHGRALLGFLKADVDHLGEALIFGLKPDRDTPSRLAQFSRTLDLFFSGWLPQLLRSAFPDCYSVYAGGDDLFLVGPWDQTAALAARLRDDFARLCQNPRLHLSAGLLLAKPGYPLARAAEAAGELLRQAKDAGRDRFSLLGHTLTWEEWRAVSALWRRLGPEAGQASSALLYHLLAYARMWRQYAEWEAWRRHPEGEQRGNPLGLRFQPLLAYDLARNVEPRRTPALYDFCQGLLSLRPGDADQRPVLDNLGLLTQLWLLERRGRPAD